MSKPTILKIALCIALSVCVPYVFYVARVYNYIHENAAKEAGPDFKYAHSISDFWITLVSAFIIFTLNSILKKLGEPLVRKMTTFEPDDTEKEKQIKMTHTTKKTLYPLVWHAFAGFVGNWVLKDEKWLPWYVFGSGNFADGFENSPFTPINPRVHTWGLIIAGYPI